MGVEHGEEGDEHASFRGTERGDAPGHWNNAVAEPERPSSSLGLELVPTWVSPLFYADLIGLMTYVAVVAGPPPWSSSPSGRVLRPGIAMATPAPAFGGRTEKPFDAAAPAHPRRDDGWSRSRAARGQDPRGPGEGRGPGTGPCSPDAGRAELSSGIPLAFQEGHREARQHGVDGQRRPPLVGRGRYHFTRQDVPVAVSRPLRRKEEPGPRPDPLCRAGGRRR